MFIFICLFLHGKKVGKVGRSNSEAVDPRSVLGSVTCALDYTKMKVLPPRLGVQNWREVERLVGMYGYNISAGVANLPSKGGLSEAALNTNQSCYMDCEYTLTTPLSSRGWRIYDRASLAAIVLLPPHVEYNAEDTWHRIGWHPGQPIRFPHSVFSALSAKLTKVRQN